MILSIIMPVYNAAPYLTNTLASIEPILIEGGIEMIIVNDGSIDESLTILQQWASDKDNVRVLSQENNGVSSARNKALLHVKGKYTWFVDADDEIASSDALNLLHKVTKQHTPDMIWASYKQVTDQTCNLGGGGVRVVNDSPKLYTTEEYLTNFFLRNGGMLWCFWLKTELIRTYQLRFNEKAKWFEDADFLLRFATYADKVFVTNSNIYIYYIRSTSAMRSSRLEDRHRCGVMLNCKMIEFANQVSNKTKKRALQIVSAISLAWCIREANDSYSHDLYRYAKHHNAFPLEIGGSKKQQLQIFVLNTNFKLFRWFCKLIK